MIKKLLSRKFLVTIGAIATVLGSTDVDAKQKAIIAGIAIVYLLIEGLLDYFGLPIADQVRTITAALETGADETPAPPTLKGVAPPGGQ